MDNAYVYLTINKTVKAADLRPKYYIGYKKIARDGGNYFGSSKHLIEDIQILGEQNFIKVILKRFTDSQSARRYEQKLLKHFNAKKNDTFYNITNGGTDFAFSPKGYEKNYLRGEDRTEKQKAASLRSGKFPSQRRLDTWRNHREWFKTHKNEFAAARRTSMLKYCADPKNQEELKQRYIKKGLTHRSRHYLKPRSNEHNEKIYKSLKEVMIRLAKMSVNDFKNYCTTLSPSTTVQNSARTKRLKGLYFLQNNIWLTESGEDVRNLLRKENFIYERV